MGMLDRIKKRQNDGFKEFVINMETTSSVTRAQIFTAGVLEDPVFMSYVMKNIRTFEHVLELDSEDIDTVLNSQEQLMGLFAKCMFGSDEAKLKELEVNFPRIITKLRDEMSYLKEVTVPEKEGAKFYILKVVRKFQMEEKIQGFPWKVPPQDIYYPKNFKDGPLKIYFENGAIAAEGQIMKGRRMGIWQHNYETGTLLAQGDYYEGYKLGPWSFYYSNGKLKAEGKYQDDLKHGLWKEWDRAGNMVEVEYFEGVKK